MLIPAVDHTCRRAADLNVGIAFGSAVYASRFEYLTACLFAGVCVEKGLGFHEAVLLHTAPSSIGRRVVVG